MKGFSCILKYVHFHIHVLCVDFNSHCLTYVQFKDTNRELKLLASPSSIFLVAVK